MTTEPQPPFRTNLPSPGTDPVDPAPASPTGTSGGWYSRHPATALLLATLAACLLMATLATLFYTRPTLVSDPILPNRPQSGDERALDALQFRTEAEEVRRLAFEPWKIESDERRHREQDRRIEAENATTDSRHRRYASDMQLAAVAWEKGQSGAVLELLEGFRPMKGHGREADDLRGFEWYYWNRQLQVARRQVSSAQYQPRAGAPDSDDSPFTSESEKATRALADQALADGAAPEQFRTLAGPGGPVFSVAFSPDGKRIIATGRDNSVSVWEAAAGKLLFTFPGKETDGRNFAISRDGKLIATAAHDNIVKVLMAESGEELFTLAEHAGPVNGIAFSADGTRIASASDDRSVKIWDALTGQELITLTGTTSAMLCVAFNPDQTSVAAGGADGGIKIWDAPRE